MGEGRGRAHRFADVAMLVVIVLAMSSCGSQGRGEDVPVPPEMSSSVPSSTGRSGPADQTTVSGVMIEGLRPICRVLQTSQRRYALVGPRTQELVPGQHVTVTGLERPDLINPCGVAFVVSAVMRDVAPGSGA
jgi:hypothetical protein